MENNKMDQAVAFVEKWAIIALILGLYFFFSIKLILFLSQPVSPDNICGTGAFAGVIVHFFFAAIVLLIFAFTFFNRNEFSLVFKLVVATAVIALPVISYNGF